MNHDNFDKEFNRTGNAIRFLSGIIIIVSIIALIGFSVLVVKVAKYVSQNGLKSTMEQIWEGPKSEQPELGKEE